VAPAVAAHFRRPLVQGKSFFDLSIAAGPPMARRRKADRPDAWKESAWGHQCPHVPPISWLVRRRLSWQRSDAGPRCRGRIPNGHPPGRSSRTRCGSAAPSVSTTCACSHPQMANNWHSDSAYRPGPLPLAAVRRALIGERQARGFQEAVAKWHRYAATIAAMRDEQQTAKPGWPALCPDWRSACGRRYCVMANGSRRHRRPRRRGDRCPTVAMRPVRTP
jgi:hypothetical protein